MSLDSRLVEAIRDAQAIDKRNDYSFPVTWFMTVPEELEINCIWCKQPIKEQFVLNDCRDTFICSRCFHNPELIKEARAWKTENGWVTWEQGTCGIDNAIDIYMRHKLATKPMPMSKLVFVTTGKPKQNSFSQILRTLAFLIGGVI